MTVIYRNVQKITFEDIMKKVTIKKLFLTMLLVLGLGTFLFVGWLVWAIVTERQPQFFPLNNSKARYTVVKSSKMGQGWDENEATDLTDLPEQRYYIEYRGEGVFADDYKKNFFRITVGNSNINLEPLVGKDVMIIKGKFVSSSKQCIINKCIDIYGPYVV